MVIEAKEIISFFVPGIPAPGGSKKAFGFKRKNGTIGVNIVDDAKRNAPWRASVAHEGRISYRGEPLVQPLRVQMEFIMPRPKGHFRTGKNSHLLRDDAPLAPGVKPDVLKLARSTEDALTGIIWKDDAQTVALILGKNYGDRPGVKITVSILYVAEKGTTINCLIGAPDEPTRKVSIFCR